MLAMCWSRIRTTTPRTPIRPAGGGVRPRTGTDLNDQLWQRNRRLAQPIFAKRQVDAFGPQIPPQVSRHPQVARYAAAVTIASRRDELHHAGHHRRTMFGIDCPSAANDPHPCPAATLRIWVHWGAAHPCAGSQQCALRARRNRGTSPAADSDATDARPSCPRTRDSQNRTSSMADRRYRSGDPQTHIYSPCDSPSTETYRYTAWTRRISLLGAVRTTRRTLLVSAVQTRHGALVELDSSACPTEDYRAYAVCHPYASTPSACSDRHSPTIHHRGTLRSYHTPHDSEPHTHPSAQNVRHRRAHHPTSSLLLPHSPLVATSQHRLDCAANSQLPPPTPPSSIRLSASA